MVKDFEDLLENGRSKLGYSKQQEVFLVMEEDGTEIEDTDYLLSLPDNTCLILLQKGDRWSPFGLGDEVDNCKPSDKSRVHDLLLKLESNPANVALVSEPDLEALLDLDTDDSQFNRFGAKFLEDVQDAADRHLQQKCEIRDTIGLLNVYHQTNSQQQQDQNGAKENNIKRKRKK